MKLNEGEEIVAEYFFVTKRVKGIMRLFTPHNRRETGIKSMLTNNRLVFLSDSGEEHYPLSKITAIKVENSLRGNKPSIIAIVTILLILFPLFYIYFLIHIVGVTGQIINTGELIVYIIIAASILIIVSKNEHITNLVITQMGGEKKYETFTAKQLQDFIDKINETLI